MWDNAVVTNAGAALLGQWAGGGTLTITKATAGDQVTDAANLPGLTALTHEVQTLSIVEALSVASGVKYRIQFQAATSAYTAKQIGVWAKLGSGSETLIAVYQDSDGIDVPASASMPDFVYAFYATVQMDNTGDLEVTLDTSALVSQSQMASAIAAGIAAILPVTVANGGTGATTAADARTNLGAVNKAGDTMTGELGAPGIVNTTPTKADHSGVADYTVRETQNGRRRSVLRTRWTAEEITRAVLYYFANNNTNYAQYQFPNYDPDTTSNETYDILTSKEAVTVAQGGTGGTTKETAKQGIGVMHGEFTTPSVNANQGATKVIVLPSAFSSTNYAVHFTVVAQSDPASNDEQNAACWLKTYIAARGTGSMTVGFINDSAQDIGSVKMAYVAVGE